MRDGQEMLTRFQKCALLVLVLLLSGMLGCAINGRNVTLNQVETPMKLDASGQNIFVNVIDKREDGLKPNEVGAVKNTYYITMSHVWADKDAAVWVKNCIEAELKRFGAIISDKDSGQASRIDVDVTLCWASVYMRWSGDVKAIVTITKNSKILIKDKEYAGKGRGPAGVSFGMPAAGYQKTLEGAMIDMLQKLLSDVVQALKT